jgi:hypothetical protein
MECGCKKIWESSLQPASDFKDNIDNFLNTYNPSLLNTFDSFSIEQHLIPVWSGLNNIDKRFQAIPDVLFQTGVDGAIYP